MKTTIMLQSNEYQTIKAMFKACSSDETRQVLCYVYYNPARKEIVATDGLILRVESIDLGPFPLFLDRKYFSLSPKQLKDLHGKTWFNGCGYADFDISFEEGLTYPDYTKVIPYCDRFKANENAPLYCIDLTIMSRFAESISINIVGIVMVPTSSTGAIMAYEMSNETKNAIFLGVIMPLRAPHTIKTIQSWSPIPEELHKEIEQMTA